MPTTPKSYPKLTLNDFNYDLPEALIAQHPSAVRSASRLLIYQPNLPDLPNLNAKIQNSASSSYTHCVFNELLNYLKPNDLLVFNDTKVLKARLYGSKATGGKIEGLLERINSNPQEGIFQLKASHAPVIGSSIYFNQYTSSDTFLNTTTTYSARILNKTEQFYTLQFDVPISQVLNTIGHLPLPPYIKHKADAVDESRYQTVFAKTAGAVAAPTASLHFDEGLMQALKNNHIEHDYLTLHVGSGTFSPVRSELIHQHTMHQEYYCLSASLIEKIANTKALGGRVIAVGTTSLRALESAYRKHADFNTPATHVDVDVDVDVNDSINNTNEIKTNEVKNTSTSINNTAASMLKPKFPEGETSIFIYPGYEFNIVDALVTNFHLPQSTLLMLLAAFIGLDAVKAVYQEAIAQSYRFFSYGDAMFCERK